jgi:hypothetical protein
MSYKAKQVDSRAGPAPAWKKFRHRPSSPNVLEKNSTIFIVSENVYDFTMQIFNKWLFLGGAGARPKMFGSGKMFPLPRAPQQMINELKI